MKLPMCLLPNSTSATAGLLTVRLQGININNVAILERSAMSTSE